MVVFPVHLMKAETIVLHSGGMDSTVCLLLALEKKRNVLSLGIDYRQRNRAELEYAARLCKRHSVQRKVLSVEWDKPSRKIPTDRLVHEMRDSVSPAFLPGRNALFLLLASMEAAALGATEVWIGVNYKDFSGYPDCRPEFLSAFRAMMEKAIPEGPAIVAPLLEMTKPEIACEARRLGLRSDDTWSCYSPLEVQSADWVPCGRCDACILHDYAWKECLSS